MNVTVQQMLRKIERELKEAGESSDARRIRERVHAIKSICELILEHPEPKEAVSLSNSYLSSNIPEPLHSVSRQPKHLKLENEANGDSIFDF